MTIIKTFPPRKTFPIRASAELLARVKTAAYRNNISANSLWVAALEAYLEADESKATETTEVARAD
ncbi:MAG: hypothetical protein ACLQVD_22995 [Capsulimonadaceae bacterium]